MSLNLIGLIGVAFTFGVAIFVHEFGHFIFAKIMKVPVATFSFGFGKKIVKYKWGETVYAIGIIPFGGYVQLGKGAEEEPPGEEPPGEEPPQEEAAEEEPAEAAEAEAEKKEKATEGIMEDLASLQKIPSPAKVLIFSAGVFFNLVTALLVLTLLYTIGFTRDAPWDAKIGKITLPIVSERFNIQKGDTIVAVDDTKVEDWIDFQNKVGTLSAQKPDEPVALTLSRDDTRITTELPFFLNDNNTSPVFSYIRPDIPAYIGQVMPNLPAEKGGLQQGDMILAINGTPVESWFEMERLIRRNPGNPCDFKIRRDGEIQTLTITPRPHPEHPGIGQLGILVGNPKKIHEQKPLPAAFIHSIELSVFMTKFLVSSIVDLIESAKLSVVRENVGGPVAIAILSYKAAQNGWAEFFNFFAILNLLLFLFNILPLPVLDGGHILIVTIEAVTRRRIPPKVLVRIFSVMMVIIIAFAVWVTLNDILMNFWRLGFGD